MTAPPPLFDRPALLRNRRRATPHGLFLHDATRDMIEDRLKLINRTFTKIAVVTPFPEIWADLWPDARIVPDDDVLDLVPEAHDLVIHATCLHWANDPVGQLIQCRRALQADGLCVAVLLGGSTLSELRTTLRDAEAEVSGGLSPRISPMGDIRDLGALLQRAGFALPVADGEILTAEYRDIWHLMRDLRVMGEPNALAQRRRRFTGRHLFEQANTLYQARHKTPSGRIPAQFELITLTGWKPADSQPQPLRPGSAAARLAEALGTDEFKLPD
ncbi:MAG: SAM-dependent methyltransferase [Paracoccaceae bacterium]